jgi:hypothetical protein
MQRKGQFIYNMLRPDMKIKDDVDMLRYKANIADRLWNLTDEQFKRFEQQFKTFSGETSFNQMENQS